MSVSKRAMKAHKERGMDGEMPQRGRSLRDGNAHIHIHGAVRD